MIYQHLRSSIKCVKTSYIIVMYTTVCVGMVTIVTMCVGAVSELFG